MTYQPTADETFALQSVLGRLHLNFPEEQYKKRPVEEFNFDDMAKEATDIVRAAMDEHDILAGWSSEVTVRFDNGTIDMQANFRPPQPTKRILVHSAMTGRARNIPVIKESRNG